LDILTEISKKGHKKKANGCLILVIVVAVLILISFVAAIYFASYRYLTLRQESKKASEHLMKQSEQKIQQAAQSIAKSAGDFEERIDTLSKSVEIQKLLEGEDKEVVEAARKIFQDYKETNQEIKAIFLGTADKRMYIYPEMELPEGYDPTSRSWYTNAVQKNEFTWSDSYVDIATGEVLITLSLPMHHNNEIKGVLSVDLNLGFIVEEIKEISLGKNGNVMITDQNGILLMHPDKALIGMPIPVDALKNIADLGEMGLIKYTYQGVNQIAAYSKIDKFNLTLIGLINKEQGGIQ
jgi:methyl-accepting chemotaxis protein